VNIPKIVTQRLLLTISGPEAAEQFVQFNRENDLHLAPWHGPMSARAFDLDACREDLERQIKAFYDDRRYSFTIFPADSGSDGPVLGYINYGEVVRGLFQAAYMGYALAKRAEGHGYMTEAAKASLQFMFETVRLHRIMANYQPQNHRSAAVLRRLGFTIEGTARNYLYIGNAWKDHVLTSLTNPQPAPPSGLVPRP